MHVLWLKMMLLWQLTFKVSFSGVSLNEEVPHFDIFRVTTLCHFTAFRHKVISYVGRCISDDS